MLIAGAEKLADHPPKNRVWGSAAFSFSRTGSTWSEVQCSRPENDPTATTTALGMCFYCFAKRGPFCDFALTGFVLIDVKFGPASFLARMLHQSSATGAICGSGTATCIACLCASNRTSLSPSFRLGGSLALPVDCVAGRAKLLLSREIDTDDKSRMRPSLVYNRATLRRSDRIGRNDSSRLYRHNSAGPRRWPARWWRPGSMSDCPADWRWPRRDSSHSAWR